jgi:hypothetical protein
MITAVIMYLPARPSVDSALLKAKEDVGSEQETEAGPSTNFYNNNNDDNIIYHYNNDNNVDDD